MQLHIIICCMHLAYWHVHDQAIRRLVYMPLPSEICKHPMFDVLSMPAWHGMRCQQHRRLAALSNDVCLLTRSATRAVGGRAGLRRQFLLANGGTRLGGRAASAQLKGGASASHSTGEVPKLTVHA